MAHGEQYDAGPTGGHEERDVRLRPLLIGLFGIAAIVAGSFVLVAAVQNVVSRMADARAVSERPRVAMRELPPEPRLQPAPVEDLHEMLAEHDALLSSYGWVDREKGVVRIPIERAMQLVAERGLPAPGVGEDSAAEVRR